ncbi:MAG: hypothetical protein IJ696_05135 [Ruminococcus sp.]|nr:hypothetical protein [Ruminococcus sp.]
MKLRKIFAGMAAATIAMTMTLSASAATNLFDIVHPDETNEEINKAYYGIGAMGFFMNQTWKWNQSEWFGINDEGVIQVEFSIGAPMADTTMSGKGTLGDMGIMLLNLPEDNYPYDIEITDAKFVAEDGTETVFESVNSIKEATLDPEGGFRVHIRPLDEVDEKTGEVTKKACPEVEGWDKEGAFNGGVLSMTLNLNPAGTAEDSGDSGSEGDGESTTDESTDENSDTSDESTDEESSEDAGSEDEESEADGDEESVEDENSEEDEDSDDGDSSSDDGKKSGGDSKDDKSSGGSTAGSASTGSGSTGSGSGNAGGSNGGSSDANAKQENSQTGAASNIILAALALAGTGMVATKKRK